MPRPARTARLRRLHSRRRDLSRAELLAALTEGDPLGVAPMAHRAWADRALLVPPSLLYARALARVADAFGAAPRATPWASWLARHVDAAAAALRAEDPRGWRAEPTLPTPFERSVASCFGVADERAAALIARFHAAPDAERRAVHALLPRALFGLPPLPLRRAPRRARDEARRGVVALRRLLAELRHLEG